jgi:hypothetical protein
LGGHAPGRGQRLPISYGPGAAPGLGERRSLNAPADDPRLRQRRHHAEPSIGDYVERTKQTIAAWNAMNGQQGGDPAKLAHVLVQLAGQDQPPLRFVAGADAIATVEQKAKDLLTQAGAYQELSGNLAYDDA